MIKARDFSPQGAGFNPRQSSMASNDVVIPMISGLEP